jgi:hypothetical protein
VRAAIAEDRARRARLRGEDDDPDRMISHTTAGAVVTFREDVSAARPFALAALHRQRVREVARSYALAFEPVGTRMVVTNGSRLVFPVRDRDARTTVLQKLRWCEERLTVLDSGYLTDGPAVERERGIVIRAIGPHLAALAALAAERRAARKRETDARSFRPYRERRRAGVAPAASVGVLPDGSDHRFAVWRAVPRRALTVLV